MVLQSLEEAYVSGKCDRSDQVRTQLNLEGTWLGLFVLE
jgi:hypothetical protein